MPDVSKWSPNDYAVVRAIHTWFTTKHGGNFLSNEERMRAALVDAVGADMLMLDVYRELVAKKCAEIDELRAELERYKLYALAPVDNMQVQCDECDRPMVTAYWIKEPSVCVACQAVKRERNP